jgi:hypothetical protein
MIVVLTRAIESLALKAYDKIWFASKAKGDTSVARGFKQSYIDAFIARIGERFEEERRSQECDSFNALVRFNRAERAVADFMINKMESGAYNKVAMIRGSKRDPNYDGLKAGRTAANGINLRANAVGAAKPTD